MTITTAKQALSKATALYYSSDPVGPVELSRRSASMKAAQAQLDTVLSGHWDAWHRSYGWDRAQFEANTVNRGAW